MKKQFTIFLILVFILGLTPFNFSEAITQNQINAEVQIVCTDGADNWFSGSGTIIDPKGIILTNRHVVEGAYKNTCFIGFLESINQEPNFGPKGNPNLAEVKYITTTEDMDAAVLYLDNPNIKTYPYVNIWNSNSGNLKFGDKIEVIGYPGIGGSTITYTSGDFSGFGSQYDNTGNYIKSTAVLEHGNSGGSAYNQKGEFVGIPSMVVTGSLNSISFILSVDSIKKWLSGFLGNQYQEEVIKQAPETVKPAVTIQQDITPPELKYFNLSFYAMDENGKEIYRGDRYGDTKGALYEFPNLRFAWKANCVYTAPNLNYLENDPSRYLSSSYSCVNDDSGTVAGYYYYFGTNPNAIPRKDGKFISQSDLIVDSPGKALIKLPEIFKANNGSNYFILQAVDNSGNISNPIINFEYVYVNNSDLDIKNMYVYDNNKNLLGKLEYPSKEKVLAISPNFPSAMWFAYVIKGIETGAKSLIISPEYGYKNKGLVYYLSYGGDNYFGYQGSDYRQGQRTSENYISINNINVKKKTNIYIKPNQDNANAFKGDNSILEINYNSILKNNKIISSCNSANCVIFYELDANLINKLKGKILLQTESHGEAYYVSPKDGKRYYMANGNEAYKIMRLLGTGITSKDLNKIKSDKNFAKKNSGKIFLQVEANGEAYYIDFNGNAHYLKDGGAAYTAMRNLGLGITNNDLSKIPEGSL